MKELAENVLAYRGTATGDEIKLAKEVILLTNALEIAIAELSFWDRQGMITENASMCNVVQLQIDKVKRAMKGKL